MPEFNIVDTSDATEAVQGRIRTPYYATRMTGYDYNGTDGFMEFGSGTPGSLPFRVDQSGNATFASITNSGSSNGITDWINVKAPAYGATGNGTTDDTAAIQAAINAAVPGQVVYVPTGKYLVSSPITLANGVILQGSYVWTFPLGDTIFGSVLKVSPSFSGSLAGGNSAVLWNPDPVTSGSGNQVQTACVQSIQIDASPPFPTNTFDGILTYGAAGLYLEDVQVTNVRGWGIRAIPHGTSPFYFPDLHKYRRCFVHQCAAGGLQIHNCPDSTFIDVYAYVNNNNAWDITPGGNTVLIGCRGEDSVQIGSNGCGFYINGNAGTGNPGAGLTLSACSTQGNGYAGVCISDTGLVNIVGGWFDGDGTGSGGTGAGIYITGQTRPVNITGIQRTAPGTPGTVDYAVSVNASSSNVSISNSTLIGVTAPVYDDGTNTVSYGAGLLTGIGTSPTLSLPPKVSNAPAPQDYSYLAWTYDPAFVGGGGAVLSTGVINLNRVEVRTPALCTGVAMFLQVAGTAASLSDSYVGLYNSAGKLIGLSADQSTNWETAGAAMYLTPLVAQGSFSLFLQPGFYWVATLSVGASTMPQFPSQAFESSALVNGTNSVATSRYAKITTGSQTALPGSFTPGGGTMTVQQRSWWLALY